MPPDRSSTGHPGRGIACVIAGVLCLTISDALAKWLGTWYAAIQLLFLRGAIALPLVAALVLWLGGRPALRTQHAKVHLLRGALNVLSACCFYTGLTLLPLAQATAMAFAAPLFVVALSRPLLKERVQASRWLAAAVGFLGVLIVVQPGSVDFQAGALLPLGTALGYALMMITARLIGPAESMLTTMLYIVVAQVVASAALQPWFWVTPAVGHLPAFAGIALFSTLGLTLLTQGFRIGPASLVAPFDYFGLLWAVLFGWLFWRELPSPHTYAGAAIIIGSGVFIAWQAARGSARRAP